MFVNQVSIKDLFSTNPNPSHGYGGRHDTSGESGFDNSSSSQGNSQFPYSQVDFPDSQDMGSQPHSQRDSAGNSPGKFYQRYMSKGPLFSRDSTQTTTSTSQPKTSYQQQVQVNKARAKDRDERDLLNSMLNAMKDCTSEVKDAVAAIKQSIDHTTSTSEAKLSQCLEKIHTDLSKNREELLNALQVREDASLHAANLQHQLTQREEKICELEKRVKDLEEAKKSRTMSDLEGVCRDHSKHLQDHLDRLYTDHQRELERQAQVQADQHHQILTSTQQQQKTLTQQHAASIRKIEQRIEGELAQQDYRLEQEQRRLREDWQRQLRDVQQDHQQQVKELVTQQMAELRSLEQGEQMATLKQQQAVLQELQQQHVQQLERIVKEQVVLHGDQQGALLKQMVTASVLESRQQVAHLQHQQYQLLQVKMQHQYEEKVNELRSRFQQEVDAIRKSVTQPFSDHHNDGSRTSMSNWSDEDRAAGTSHGDISEGRGNPLGDAVLVSQGRSSGGHHALTAGQPPSLTSPTLNVVDPELLCSSSRMLVTTAENIDLFTSRYHRPFRSPISTLARSWSSKTLFSKSSPLASPVVAVRPHVHQTLDDHAQQLSDVYAGLAPALVQPPHHASLKTTPQLNPAPQQNPALQLNPAPQHNPAPQQTPAPQKITAPQQNPAPQQSPAPQQNPARKWTGTQNPQVQAGVSVESGGPPTAGRSKRKSQKRKKSNWSKNKKSKRTKKSAATGKVSPCKNGEPGAQPKGYALRRRVQSEQVHPMQEPPSHKPKSQVSKDQQPPCRHGDTVVSRDQPGISTRGRGLVSVTGEGRGLVSVTGEPQHGEPAPRMSYSSKYQKENCADVFAFSDHLPPTELSSLSQRQGRGGGASGQSYLDPVKWEAVRAIPAPQIGSRTSTHSSRLTEKSTLDMDEDNSQGSEEAGSQSSSPSMSITEVFVKRHVRYKASPTPAHHCLRKGSGQHSPVGASDGGIDLERAVSSRSSGVRYMDDGQGSRRVKDRREESNTVATHVVEITRSVRRGRKQ